MKESNIQEKQSIGKGKKERKKERKKEARKKEGKKEKDQNKALAKKER